MKTPSSERELDRNAALARILTEAASGQLVFSTHAEVALRVRLALESPRLHLEDAVRLVQAEPLLATRVVALANSVAFNRSGQAVADVKSAVSLLGLQMLRLLATALIMRQMVGAAGSAAQRELAGCLWQHCAQIGALSNVLARRLTGQAPDMALFCGMVHEIGGFYLIARASEHPRLLAAAGGPSWSRTEADKVGCAVLRALQVPLPLTQAIETIVWARLVLPPVSLGDILFLAHQLSPLENPLTELGSEDAEATELRRLIGSDARLAAVLGESQFELDSLVAALQF